jgi:CTD kinase subunit beta
MLEASSFDFRGRHPQQLTIKLLKYYGLTSTSAVAKTAFQVSLDLYRTFAPLKQTTATMAFASLELAGRLHDQHIEAVESGADYGTWNVERAEVMGT